MKKEIKIVLAPTRELAETCLPVAATVEAEFGEVCLAGNVATLAHHGPRSGNPAPCNAKNVPVLPDGSVILISHLDLDTLGGVLALIGIKPEDEEFWNAAEYIDLNGVHHVYDLPKETGDKMNAWYAYAQTEVPRYERDRITDMTKTVFDCYERLCIILDSEDPEHDRVIESGRMWVKKATELTESKLISDDGIVRVFITDGPFTAASYYSPKYRKAVKATVTLNTKTGAITVAFEDGGKKISAEKIVKEYFGEGAGGRAGIAGSPRGMITGKEDLENIVKTVRREIEKL